MGFYRESFVCLGSRVVKTVVVVVVGLVFHFVNFVSRYSLTKGQMTSAGHFENLPVAA